MNQTLRDQLAGAPKAPSVEDFAKAEYKEKALAHYYNNHINRGISQHAQRVLLGKENHTIRAQVAVNTGNWAFPSNKYFDVSGLTEQDVIRPLATTYRRTMLDRGLTAVLPNPVKDALSTPFAIGHTRSLNRLAFGGAALGAVGLGVGIANLAASKLQNN